MNQPDDALMTRLVDLQADASLCWKVFRDLELSGRQKEKDVDRIQYSRQKVRFGR
jgi:hypothetical protein